MERGIDNANVLTYIQRKRCELAYCIGQLKNAPRDAYFLTIVIGDKEIGQVAGGDQFELIQRKDGEDPLFQTHGTTYSVHNIISNVQKIAAEHGGFHKCAFYVGSPPGNTTLLDALSALKDKQVIGIVSAADHCTSDVLFKGRSMSTVRNGQHTRL